MAEPRKSKISNAEWGLVLGATATIDVVQAFLDGADGLGVVINRFIDIVVGLSLVTYFLLRGVKLNAKRILALCLSFVLEEIPGLDAMPLWSGDVIYTWFTVRAEEKGILTKTMATQIRSKARNLPPPRRRKPIMLPDADTYTHDSDEENTDGV